MDLNAEISKQSEWAKKDTLEEKEQNYETQKNKKLTKEQKHWFRRQNKFKNEPLIYYAEMKSCSSFPRYMRQTATERSRRRQIQSKSYLEKVMSKQYTPKVLVFDRKSTGELSAPMCREVHECLSSVTVESDVCSCCYGNFQNIDKYIHKPHYSTILEEPSTSSQQCFYDDKFYDIVPVKEKSNAKAKHEEKLQQKINMQEVLENMDMLCKPSEIRPKLRPVTVNYHTITPNKNWVSQKLTRKNKYLAVNRLNKKQKIASRQSTNTSCSIECGKVYLKSIKPVIKFSKLPKNRRIKYADLETLHVNKNQEPPNKTTNNIHKQAGMSTEETLKQIKSILIAVLSEVKSSSQSQTLGREKRDVVIQKGLSQSDMAYSNSGLLHNLSCGPFGMNPYMANSQLLPNVCYPMTCPLRYSQNYPILVQTQPKPLCSNCYKPRSMESQQISTKRIVSASTNTAEAVENKRTTETENLIKEIYKSIALGLETPAATRKFEGLGSVTRAQSVKSVASKVTKNANANIDEDTSPFLTSENKSVTARVNVTSYGEDRQKKRVVEDPQASDIDAYKEDVEEETESENSTAKSESAESESTVVPAKDTSKGLFSKMLSSIFKKKKKDATKNGNPKEILVSDDNESDSDDYQTVYSHEIPTTSARRGLRRPARTTYSHSKRPIPLHKERRLEKKNNYFMDEEYRRQWAMKLAERENRMYNERPRLVAPATRSRRNAYSSNYETLQALMQYRDQFEESGARGRLRSTGASADGNEPVEKSDGWLKRHKFRLKCLPEWKKILFER